MKKLILAISIILLNGSFNLFAQQVPETEIFLLTCSPGTATYSIYGHSALRIVIPEQNSDLVYNWGVFDFSTPNFAWKFAKGRLEYMLGVYSYKKFLQEYFMEQRSVYLQKINLEIPEKELLIRLISENLKPENIKYRYDFFYDNCSTRIRDILEKSVGGKLFYPPDERKGIPTFRDKIGEYQSPYPWLKLGVDLLVGTPGDKKASFRDRMFLPIDMQKGLSEALISRDGKMIPMLSNPETVLEFDPPVIKQKLYTSPIFIFSLLLVVIILFSAFYRNKTANKVLDIMIFVIFSVLALLMIFFNFFSDHPQLKWNLNIIWLNPFIILCLASVVLNRDWHVWFRIVFFMALLLTVILLIFPGAFNNAFIPLLLILLLRSAARAGFSWNPLSVHTDQS
ncbi:MAG: DUF4105 domain-containing protein [Bacteroidales bacterium]|nr:DUF4105 domain-containing protein [Bacteroidales bacterium]